MPLETSPEQPIPVRTVARLIGELDRAGSGRVWVEGQVTQLTRRPGAATVFLTLRDPVADVSLQGDAARARCSTPSSRRWPTAPGSWSTPSRTSTLPRGTLSLARRRDPAGRAR